jgi:hypothetical protein
MREEGVMTTLTLKEADRYLINGGFLEKSTADLGGQFQARYEFRDLNAKPPRGIMIKLHDYGDGHWTSMDLAYSKDLEGKALQTTAAMAQLPGFELPRI